MKAYRPVLYVSLIVLAVAAILPLITLRSFDGYIQAWLRFLGLIIPAALLAVLLILYPRLPPRTLRLLTVASMAVIAIAWLLGRVNILFFLLFLTGALALVLVSQRSEAADRDAPS